MIRAIAIDDEPPALQVIKAFCSRTDMISLEGTFTKTSLALDFLKNNPVDLLFLDINMPAISGLDFYKNLDAKMMVIFTTAYAEYAIEGFSLNAIDYLLKPIKPERFYQAIDKAAEYHSFRNQKSDNVFYVKSDASQLKVAAEDVLFIEAYTDYIKIHRKDKKTVISRMTMKAIEELLPPGFLRVHRSFIVSVDKVETYSPRLITIADQEIPIGRKYLSQTNALLKST